MKYCFDLLNKRFDVPKLVCEIAGKVKTEASYGVHTAHITDLSYFNGRVTVEFHTTGTDYIKYHYALDNPYMETSFRELLVSLGCKEEPPYWNEREFRSYLQRIVENIKDSTFKVLYNYDSFVVLGKAV